MPPRGSPRDLVLAELYRREVHEKVQASTVEISLLARSSGIPTAKIKDVVQELTSYLSQEAYDSRGLRERLTRRLEELRQLDRVANLSSS